MASLKRNVKKNGKVVYRIDIFLGVDKSGKRVAKVITYEVNQNASVRQQVREAQRYAMEVEEKLKKGIYFDSDKMSLEEFAEKWLANKKTSLNYSTLETYSRIVNQKILPYFRVSKLNRIQTPQVEEFYHTLLDDHSNATIRKIANVLNGMFKTAVRWGMLQINPCQAAIVPRDSEEETSLKFYTPEQSLMFLRSLDLTFHTEVKGHRRIDDTGKPYLVEDYLLPRKLPLQLKVFYYLSLYCGFRKSETLALCWSDIDFENKTINISKSVGKSEEGAVIKRPKTSTSIRTVSLPKNIMPLLVSYKWEYDTYKANLGTAWQGEDNLFIQEDGKRMDRSTPYQSFKRHLGRYNEWVQSDPMAKEQGFEELPDIPLHGLRHSCATLLNYLEVNIASISKVLGHAKVSTTMDIYAHAFDEQSREAADKLDQFLRNNHQQAI